MKTLLLYMVFCLITGGPALASGENRVTLCEKAFVSGEYIHVGDIAKVEGADSEELSAVAVMKAPSGPLGVTLSQAFVTGRIRERWQRPAAVGGASSVQVFEKYAKLSGKELEDIYRQWILRNSPWKGVGDVVIEDVRVPSGLRVPEKDRHRIQAKFSPREDFLGFVSATLTAGSGTSAASCRVSGKVRVTAEVPVARTHIPRGALIAEADLELRRLDISVYPSLVLEKKECLGMRVKSPLRAGRPFPKTNIEQPPLISRGDPVFIEARCGGLVVRDRGIALKDGSFEELIPVRNATSGRQVFGTVIAASRIEVLF